MPDEILQIRKLLLATPPPVLEHTAGQQCVAETLLPSPIDRRKASLLRVLKTGDTASLYRWIVPATNGIIVADAAVLTEEEQERFQIIAQLPPTVFSEVLRSLDPFAVAAQRDYAQDIVVSPGLAQFTPLRALVDRYGIRVLYTGLLRALMSIYAMRTEAGQGVLLQDCVVLLRCAGAASSIDTAKRIWHGMEATGYVVWRQSEVYTEFVRARFLTEALYTQYDRARLRVRPVNLHRQKLMVHPRRLARLDSLRRALERYKVQRFGQNPSEPDYAEHLTRLLRKTKPVRSVLAKAAILGYVHDERLLAAVMIAFGRTGSVEALGTILAHYWKVRVVRSRATGTVAVSGGANFAPGSPMRPSAVLLDAVVQAYCCSGEVACALQVVDFLARRYGLAIPDKVWFDLLDWTYVMTTKPASTEWKAAGLPGRVLTPSAVEAVWAAMTAAPYHVRPGFAQYHILVKTLIQQRKFASALDLMRQAKPLYREQLQEHEAALVAFQETARQQRNSASSASGALVPAVSAASARLRRAAYKKWHMWYCFQTWCWHFLKGVRPRALDDPLVVHTIPQLIDEFRPFVPRDARYRTKTGRVLLREPHRHQHAKHIVAAETVDLPALRPHVRFQHNTPDMGYDGEVAAPTTDGDHLTGVSLAAETHAAATSDHHITYDSTAAVAGEDEQHRMQRLLVRGVLRRRRMWVRKPVLASPELPPPGVSRAWLVREFA